MLEYQLITGGYVLLKDGIVWVDQPFDPAKPFIDGQGQPFDTPQAAQAHAQALLESLQA